MQAHGFADVPRPLRALQTASHEQATPAVRARVGEDAEGFVSLRRMLPAFEESKPGVQMQIGDAWMRQRCSIEFELEDVPPRRAPGMQQPEF